MVKYEMKEKQVHFHKRNYHILKPLEKKFILLRISPFIKERMKVYVTKVDYKYPMIYEKQYAESVRWIVMEYRLIEKNDTIISKTLEIIGQDETNNIWFKLLSPADQILLKLQFEEDLSWVQ